MIYNIIHPLFLFAASCYILYLIAEPLEKTGAMLGKLFHIPEGIVAATFCALATSGPEIMMAIKSASYDSDAKACSGALNMGFSAMDNLIGIGCMGMFLMVYLGYSSKETILKVSRSVLGGLLFYIVSASCFAMFLLDFEISKTEAWILAIIGIVFIVSQLFLPVIYDKLDNNADIVIEEDDIELKEIPKTTRKYITTFIINISRYVFCVYALWVFVDKCLYGTFLLSNLGFVSIAGVLVMFTSYVSSFPEFMMAYKYASKGKENALLSMLFGSNVIDLAFSGLKPIMTGKPMAIVASNYLPLYIGALPLTAIILFVALLKDKLKYKHAYIMAIFYVLYIVTGFILL